MPHKGNVYVIDDDPAMRDSLDFLLGSAGFNVTLFDSAQKFLEAMPSLAFGCVVSDVRMTGMDGVESDNAWAAFDTGAAWMSLAIQAAKLGLYAHGMGGFDAAAMAKALNMPEGLTIHAAAAIGQIGAAEALPEGLREREVPSNRLPLDEIAFHGSF